MSRKKQTFENAMNSLEEIVDNMEAGRMDLDASIASFEEGTKLIEFCQKCLDETEKKIEVLLKKSDPNSWEEISND